MANWEIKAISSSVSFLRNLAGLPQLQFQTEGVMDVKLNVFDISPCYN